MIFFKYFFMSMQPRYATEVMTADDVAPYRKSRQESEAESAPSHQDSQSDGDANGLYPQSGTVVFRPAGPSLERQVAAPPPPMPYARRPMPVPVPTSPPANGGYLTQRKDDPAEAFAADIAVLLASVPPAAPSVRKHAHSRRASFESRV